MISEFMALYCWPALQFFFFFFFSLFPRSFIPTAGECRVNVLALGFFFFFFFSIIFLEYLTVVLWVTEPLLHG